LRKIGRHEGRGQGRLKKNPDFVLTRSGGRRRKKIMPKKGKGSRMFVRVWKKSKLILSSKTGGGPKERITTKKKTAEGGRIDMTWKQRS